MNAEMKKKLAKNWFKILQDMICRGIEELEGGKKFIVTEWKRNKKNEGGGEYRVLKEGKIFEKEKFEWKLYSIKIKKGIDIIAAEIVTAVVSVTKSIFFKLYARMLETT